MAKRKIEEELEQLGDVRQLVPAEAVEAALRKALRDKVNLIVAKAAAVASDLQMASLLPEMLTAYDRMFTDPVKNDAQCWGKNALAKALKTLMCQEAAPFLRGVRHVQMEPVWGGEADSAPGLRGTCALALVQCTDIPAQQILSSLVDCLADAAAPVREDAVQALAQWGSADAILLLRLKARLGDIESAVTGNIFDALLRLEGVTTVEFVGSFLDSRDEAVREEAALSLGSAKLEQAITLLINRWRKRGVTDSSAIWIRALGASRLPSAFAFLLEIVREERQRESSAALQALQSWRLTTKTWEEIAAAVSSRHDGDLTSTFERDFPRPDEI